MYRKNIGASLNELNVSILVYADDILLISPLDKHLQKLLNICSKFGSDWHIKFNPSKSQIISFGDSIFEKCDFFLNECPLTEVDNLKYLETFFNKKMDFNKLTCEKFKNVRSSIFSLSFIGLKPNSISPFLQYFFYKTYCLSNFTYALETTYLQTKTLNFLNKCQNDCIRRIIGLKK